MLPVSVRTPNGVTYTVNAQVYLFDDAIVPWLEAHYPEWILDSILVDGNDEVEVRAGFDDQWHKGQVFPRCVTWEM